MATFLKPDKIITTENGLTIKQKIIPDSLLAPKDVASWIRKGQKMKPCAKLNNGTGKPRAICVHNTGDIKVASGTNAAEQYTRATYNGNMSGVVVHFYVWDTEIWQNLREDERGWHAADGSTRRSSQRKDGSTLGGNLDTIAIECIGDRKLSEDTTAKLVAWLCKKHDLDPKTDVCIRTSTSIRVSSVRSTSCRIGTRSCRWCRSTTTLSPARRSRRKRNPQARRTPSSTATPSGRSRRRFSAKAAATPRS